MIIQFYYIPKLHLNHHISKGMAEYLQRYKASITLFFFHQRFYKSSTIYQFCCQYDKFYARVFLLADSSQSRYLLISTASDEEDQYNLWVLQRGVFAGD